MFLFDKFKAKNKKRRISNKTLFSLCIIGGSIGGLFGMYLFHHKTKKAQDKSCAFYSRTLTNLNRTIRTVFSLLPLYSVYRFIYIHSVSPARLFAVFHPIDICSSKRAISR